MPSRPVIRYLCRILLAAAILFIAATVLLAIDGLRDRLGHADVALVLGSKVETDGTPSPGLRARLDRTLELDRAGCFREVIVSGGFGKEGHDEATVMKEYLVANGIAATRVIVDSHGDNTFLSAAHARDIADEHHYRSIIVVSQYFHLPRTRLALQRFGMPVVYSAHARYFSPKDLYFSMRETVGFAVYWLRNYKLQEPGSRV